VKPTGADAAHPRWRNQVEAIIFDFGGVIATGIGEALDGLVKACGAGRPLSPERVHKVWQSLYTEASLGHIRPDELWEQFRQRIDLGSLSVGWEEPEFLSRIQLREPGIAQTLAQLKKRYRVGLLSNHIGPWVRALLQRFELMPYFQAVVVSSEIGARKPDRLPYLRTCQLLQVAPERAVYVADEEEDLIGCQAVGMLPVFIPGEDVSTSIGLHIQKVSDLVSMC
jgi:HAD superfamily hydrolase (TIGR01549 family)